MIICTNVHFLHTYSCNQRRDDERDNDAFQHIQEDLSEEAHIELCLSLAPWFLPTFS